MLLLIAIMKILSAESFQCIVKTFPGKSLQFEISAFSEVPVIARLSKGVTKVSN